MSLILQEYLFNIWLWRWMCYHLEMQRLGTST